MVDNAKLYFGHYVEIYAPEVRNDVGERATGCFEFRWIIIDDVYSSKAAITAVFGSGALRCQHTGHRHAP